MKNSGEGLFYQRSLSAEFSLLGLFLEVQNGIGHSLLPGEGQTGRASAMIVLLLRKME